MSNPIVTHEFKGNKFFFNSTPQAEVLIQEIFSDNYRVLEKGIEFLPGDVILDIGACEGMFSVMMAKLFPMVRVVSLEPVPRTFYHLIRNIGLNGATNIEPHNIGVGIGKMKLMMSVPRDNHSGGSSAVMTFTPEWQTQVEVDVASLDEILGQYDKVKLLKMDIEGLEYDVIYPSKLLGRVENFVGEFHINQKLKDELGRDIMELATFVGSKTNLMYYEPCYMAE